MSKYTTSIVPSIIGILKDGKKLKAKEITEELNKYKELKNLHEEYIELLKDEVDELFMIAHSHGWRSNKGPKAIELLNKINEYGI